MMKTMMTKMMMMILSLSLILSVHSVESVIEVTGYVGGSALIRCPYDNEYEEYSKYLCRGSCPVMGGKDIPVRTQAGQTKAVDGRFSLHDDTTARVFTVTITGLTAKDSGKYWCSITTGFGRNDVFTEVALKVSQAPVVTSGSKLLTNNLFTATEVTDLKTVSTLVTTDYPVMSFNALVCSSAAGVAVLLTLAVVLGRHAAKRKKRCKTPVDSTLSRNTDTETTRERNRPEIDPVYEGLGLKQYESEAEYGNLEAVSPGKILQAEGVLPHGKGDENEYESMRDTLSRAGKDEGNEYESMRDTLSKAGKYEENEYESMRDTLSRAGKYAENEYESMSRAGRAPK